MALSAQKFREIVFQCLYSHDIGKNDDSELVGLLSSELEVSKKNVRDALSQASLVQAKLDEIDNLISAASLSYSFERIPGVEKNILRLGVFELLFDDTIPAKVAISEGLRLSKKFSTPESAAFVNAVLDNIHKSFKGLPIEKEAIHSAIEKLSQSEEKTKQIHQNSDFKEQHDSIPTQ